jgi:UDP-2,3-diacylglucosamine pyrophosphatase LpxH
MFTDKRLSSAYNNAKLEYIDENSKYIFFSDCHRGDDSVSDEFTRNQILFLHALDYYYRNDYTYVEAGDGDELWEYPNFKNIRLAHSDIFIMMKKFFKDGRLRILYGNHNIYLKRKYYVKKNYFTYYDEYTQKRYDLFPGLTTHEAMVLKMKKSGQEILVVHGHQGDLMNDQCWYAAMLLLRYFWRFMHVVGFQNPASPAKNLYKRHRIEKNYKVWIRKHKKVLICGHTHRPKFPKEKELPYFNTGCCIHTKGIVGIEIADGNIALVNWRIKANREGTLRITRNYMRGPEPIEKYKFKE